jgi:hypothetical protein
MTTQTSADEVLVTFPYRNKAGEHVRCPFCERAWGACYRNPCDSMGRYTAESSANTGETR